MCTNKVLQKLGSAMKLIDQIIELLSSKDGSLTDAFLKTKILIHKIGISNIKDGDWINDELNGYPEDTLLPDYRIIQSQVFVNAANSAYRFQEHQIPLTHLNEQQQESLTKAKMRHSVLELEKFVEKPTGTLVANIPPESYGLLEKGLDKGVFMSQAWCVVGKSDVIKILSYLRNRLLDFVLSLKSVFAYELSEDEFEKEKASIPGFLNNAAFGDNATIVVTQGSNNSVGIQIQQHNFDVLRETLATNGVSIEDIEALKNALSQDSNHPDVANKKFGPEVKAWMGNMFTKALNTFWQIDIGIVSGLLTTAIQKYYGWQ
jgi:hypothetical protein